MSVFGRILLWIVWRIPLGTLAPWVLGLAVGSKPERMEK